MLFLVCRTRNAGVLVPERELRTSTGVVGEFRVYEQADLGLRRTVRIPSMCDPTVGKQQSLLLPLYDPHLLWAAAGGIAVGGVERIRAPDGSDIEYGQVRWMRAP